MYFNSVLPFKKKTNPTKKNIKSQRFILICVTLLTLLRATQPNRFKEIEKIKTYGLAVNRHHWLPLEGLAEHILGPHGSSWTALVTLQDDLTKIRIFQFSISLLVSLPFLLFNFQFSTNG